MRYLEDVQITLADQGGCGPCENRCLLPFGRLGQLARETLALWVPWERYPHQIVGDDGIISSLKEWQDV